VLAEVQGMTENEIVLLLIIFVYNNTQI